MKPGKPPTWDQHSIKAELHRRGMTLSALAESIGMKPNNFGHVWKRTNRKAEKAIADFLGVPAEQLFPDRYPIKKTRILSSRYAQRATSGNRGQDRAAA
ncbi:helix-turn-helix domain-containing protein [Stappia stellulata]|uniref:helix-turn-helix domain-containing protein n=1 Tax=Stappia stellulata TaxID=71235 RepID=UPI001CD52F47|nr:helix-turn-helix transcriptional regulator [Stappia stellulata]MCA1242977.1 helix-turn-helix domain-containing protein [Stappia stellulata]